MNVTSLNAEARARQSTFRFTVHAAKRMQQRGFKKSVIALLLQHGSRKHAVGGAIKYIADRRAIQRCSRSEDRKKSKLLSEYSGAYLIAGKGNEIITAAHSR